MSGLRKEDGFPGQISYVLPDKIVEMVKANPLVKDLYLTDIGFYPNARFHFRERAEGLNQSILIYNVTGEGKVVVDKSEYHLPPNHFMIIPPNRPHAYYSDVANPWSIYWIHFGGSKVAYFNQYALQVTSIERDKTSRINERITIFNELFRNLERGYSIETLEYVNMTLHYLLSSFIHLDRFRLINESKDNEPVTLSINFMLQNLNRSLKLKDLAEEVNLSVPHFSRLFLAQTGHSPIDYFLQLRIQQACRLLDNTKQSIAEIAYEMGFDNQFYFSRLFKKLMDMSPRAYRKR